MLLEPGLGTLPGRCDHLASDEPEANAALAHLNPGSGCRSGGTCRHLVQVSPALRATTSACGFHGHGSRPPGIVGRTVAEHLVPRQGLVHGALSRGPPRRRSSCCVRKAGSATRSPANKPRNARSIAIAPRRLVQPCSMVRFLVSRTNKTPTTKVMAETAIGYQRP